MFWKTNQMYLLLLLFFPLCYVTAKWMDSVIVHHIYAPKIIAFQLYSELDQHPKWSPWLETVEYDQLSGLSQWTVYSLGLRYSWKANNTEVNPPYTMQWESISGLPNKGKVEFITVDESVLKPEFEKSVSNHIAYEELEDGGEDLKYEHLIIKLTVSYDLPTPAAVVLKTLGSLATSFIYNTILGDLKRFGEHLSKHLESRKVNITQTAQHEQQEL